MTKSRRLWLILALSFVLGAAITIAEPDLQVLATNVPAIDKTALVLTVSVGVGLFLMICMARILLRISLRTLLIVFYALVFLGAFLSDRSILSVAFDSGGVTTGPMTVPFIMALGVGVASIRSDEDAKADSFGLVALCSIGPVAAVLLLGAIYQPETDARGRDASSPRWETPSSWAGSTCTPSRNTWVRSPWRCCRSSRSSCVFQVVSLHLRRLPFARILVGHRLYICRPGAVSHGRERWLLAARLCPRRAADGGLARVAAGAGGHAHGLVHHRRRACGAYPQPAGRGAERGRDLGKAPWA